MTPPVISYETPDKQTVVLIPTNLTQIEGEDACNDGRSDGESTKLKVVSVHSSHGFVFDDGEAA